MSRDPLPEGIVDVRRHTNREHDSGGIAPVGAILAYGAATAPTGWLLCDGSLLNRDDHRRLFLTIGTTFNTGGEAATEFRVPDLRGRFPLGLAAAGTGSTLGGSGGAIDHTHTTGAPSATTGATAGGVNVGSDTHDHGATGTQNPPFLAVQWIIKT